MAASARKEICNDDFAGTIAIEVGERAGGAAGPIPELPSIHACQVGIGPIKRDRKGLEAASTVADIERVSEMIREVRALGLETCATLGMVTPEQAAELKDAGLDYYNHNVDSSEEYYRRIISTRTYQHRLDTLEAVREAGLKVCSGGIVGMGETRTDRAGMLVTLANLPEHPQSVPINQLVQVAGTPLATPASQVEPFEFIRTIAVARILMPKAQVRLSAGRQEMSDETQALAFLAGANSIFYGEKLLTTGNPDVERDRALLERLGITPETQAQTDARSGCC